MGERKGEETRSLEIGTVVMASGHPWRGKLGGGMWADVVLLQRIFVEVLDICFNMGVCVVVQNHFSSLNGEILSFLS